MNWEYIPRSYVGPDGQMLHSPYLKHVQPLIEKFGVKWIKEDNSLKKTFETGYYVKARVKTLDGLCGIMIVHDWDHSYQVEKYKPFMQALDTIASWGNYTKIMVSHVHTPLVAFWQECGYVEAMAPFTNFRTTRNVHILMKDVQPWIEEPNP